MGFLFLNHYLDLAEAVEDQNPDAVQNDDITDTDIPTEIPLPASLYLSVPVPIRLLYRTFFALNVQNSRAPLGHLTCERSVSVTVSTILTVTIRKVSRWNSCLVKPDRHKRKRQSCLVQLPQVVL